MLGLRRALLALFALGVVFAALVVALVLPLRPRGAEGRHGDPRPAHRAELHRHRRRSPGGGARSTASALLMTGVGFAWFLAALTESDTSTRLHDRRLLRAAVPRHRHPHGARVPDRAPRDRRASARRRPRATSTSSLVRLPFFLLGGDIVGDLDRRRARDNVFAVIDARRPGRRLRLHERRSSPSSCLVSTLVLLRAQAPRGHAAPAPRAGARCCGPGWRSSACSSSTFLLDVVGAPTRIVDVVGLARPRRLRGAAVRVPGRPRALALLARRRGRRADRAPQRPPRPTGTLRDALADALGDRSLMLVYWRPSAGHYVTFDGRRVGLPEAGSGRAVTEVRARSRGQLAGRRVGAIIHDDSLGEEPGLVRAAAASAALALENERLEAELRARLEELQHVALAAGGGLDVERRRLERDLHDGAQQRLVALSLAARPGPAPARGRPGAAAERAARRRARGARRARSRSCASSRAASIPPSSPTAASSPRWRRSPSERRCRSDLDQMPAERLPAPVEAAAYFVVAEALTNVAKYAGARPRHGARSRRDGRLRRGRGRRRRRRRRRSRPRHRPARPRRPRRGARRPPRGPLARPARARLVRAEIPCA